MPSGLVDAIYNFADAAPRLDALFVDDLNDVTQIIIDTVLIIAPGLWLYK